MILILLTIIILILFNTFLIYLLRIRKRLSKNDNELVKNSLSQVRISIIVAAKNEAGNIPQLLRSIEKLDYPSELFEVIIVDDNSSDETFNVCLEAAAKYNFLKVF